MQINRIELDNFRSYSQKAFEFSPNTTLIIGPNTSGKTNLIEAIYLLAHGQSWRPGLDRELIAWENELARVKGVVKTTVGPDQRDVLRGQPKQRPGHRPGLSETELELVLTGGEIQGKKVAPKRYRVNGVGKRRQDFIDHLAVVLFSPEDLMLILNSPSTRRRYLDTVLDGVDRKYRQFKVDYDKALKARNALLDHIREGRAKRSELEYWDEILVRAGQYLTQKRQELIKFINTHEDQAGDKDQLEYLQNEITQERLKSYYQREIAFGATLVGPHRDDFKFQITSSSSQTGDIAVYGSRGQQRTAVFWLKLGELAYVTQELGRQPVLLLDDLFSELDHQRRRQILEIIPRHQTIMTTTDIHLVEKDFLDRVDQINL